MVVVLEADVPRTPKLSDPLPEATVIGIGADPLYGGHQIAQVFRLQRVGFVVGKSSIGFEVEAFDLEIELLQNGLQTDRGHSIATIDGDLQLGAPAARR